MDIHLVDYQVTVQIQGEVKQYDVRSISVSECEKDFRKALQPYGLSDIKVNLAPDARFKKK